MKNNGLASRVKALRASKGYSQEYLAECCRLSLRTVQRIENGETQPHGDTLQRLALCFDIPVVELIEVTEVTNPTLADLPEDKVYLMAMHLSALSFVLWSPLGVIVPFVLWLMKRNSIKNINATGKRVLNFQITWCVIYYAWYALVISSTLFIFAIPLPSIGHLGRPEMILISILALHVYNVILILVNTFLSFNGRSVFYQPAVKVLR